MAAPGSGPAGAGAHQPRAASGDAATPAGGADAPTGASKAERPAREKPEQDAIPGKLKEELKSLGYLE